MMKALAAGLTVTPPCHQLFVFLADFGEICKPVLISAEEIG